MSVLNLQSSSFSSRDYKPVPPGSDLSQYLDIGGYWCVFLLWLGLSVRGCISWLKSLFPLQFEFLDCFKKGMRKKTQSIQHIASWGAMWPNFGSAYECLSNRSPWGKTHGDGLAFSKPLQDPFERQENS